MMTLLIHLLEFFSSVQSLVRSISKFTPDSNSAIKTSSVIISLKFQNISDNQISFIFFHELSILLQSRATFPPSSLMELSPFSSPFLVCTRHSLLALLFVSFLVYTHECPQKRFLVDIVETMHA